jgi:hypothetical protein
VRVAAAGVGHLQQQLLVEVVAEAKPIVVVPTSFDSAALPVICTSEARSVIPTLGRPPVSSEEGRRHALPPSSVQQNRRSCSDSARLIRIADPNDRSLGSRSLPAAESSDNLRFFGKRRRRSP